MHLSSTTQSGQCEKIIVRTGDGRVFNLGSPDSILYPLRRKIYLFKRRKELK